MICRLSVDGKHLENGAFQKRWRQDNYVISLPELSKMATECSVFKALRRCADGSPFDAFSE